jgi:hypothetical protein
VFAWGADGQPVLAAPPPEVEFLAGLDLGMDGPGPPCVVDLRSAWAADRFTRPGFAALDHARLAVLRSWLEDPAVPAPEGLCIASSHYFTAGARARVLELALRGLDSGSPRAGVALWASLREDPGARSRLEDAAGGMPEAVRPRVVLLCALAARDLAGILAALAQVAASGAALTLPEEAGERLAACLADGLDREAVVRRHAEILGHPAVPEPYLEWARREVRRLTFALAAFPGPAEPLRALARHTGAPYAAWISAWRRGDPPLAADAAALEGAAPELRRDLARCLHADWREAAAGAGAKQRQALLPWLRLLPASACGCEEDPLLRLDREGSEAALSAAELRQLTAAIGDGRIPAELQPLVAAAVLRCWARCCAMEGFKLSQPGWRQLIAHWPAAVRLALVNDGSALTAEEGETAPEIRTAAENLALPSALLEELIDKRRQASPQALSRVVPLLWRWCSNAVPGSRPLAPDLCRQLARGVLPEFRVDPAAAERAAFLLRQGAFFERHPDYLLGLWRAARRGWQLLLLLGGAPRADLEPSAEQLEALIPLREDLARHLALPDLHPKRRSRFEIATHDFHAGVYAARGGQWRREYQATALWAAFARVPFKLQGDLGRALAAYAGGEPRSNQRRRIELAKTYLGNSWEMGRAETARRIAWGVILPLARECGFERRQLLTVMETVYAQPRRRTGTAYPALRESVEQVQALALVAQHPCIAQWFRYFLLDVRQFTDGDRVLDALTREPRP